MVAIALVTGTSSGMGLHTAVGLAARGATVVATMRDPARAGELTAAAEQAGVQVQVRALDVTEQHSIDSCLAEVSREFGSVEVLVNNAGRGRVATLEQLERADLQEQLDVNYLGVAAMTKAVLPGMRAAGRGRIVTVTSVGGVIGQPFADAYCGAKFAVEGLMQSLAPVLAKLGITVSVVEPGAVASSFVANVKRPEPAADDPYGELLQAYLRRSDSSFAQAQTPAAAAEVIVEAALTDTPRFRWQTSAGASAFAGLSLADLDGSRVLGATGGWLEV